MTDKQLLDHYRTLYQVAKRDKDICEQELDEFKTLCTMQQDIINTLNKRIEKQNNSINILENRILEVADTKTNVRIISIK